MALLNSTNAKQGLCSDTAKGPGISRNVDEVLRPVEPSLTVTDISFEQAAVLFNIASLMSGLAAVQGQQNDEQLKAMARLFQQSAGAFAQLKETVVKMLRQQNPTTDLLPDSLTAFSSLMLAQAQEAIYIKAAKDSLKTTALVKIAQQLAEFYHQTEKLFAREPVSNICEKSWQTLLNGKALLYSGLAHLHQVQLGEAQRLLSKAKGAVGSSLLYKENMEKVVKMLDTAKKENDFIYHAQVPGVKTLEELPKSSLVKPAPVQFPMSTGFVDLFESLVQEPGQKKTILEKVWRFLSPDS
uniref:BRO1 domain-containing protein n=1 Tax=Ditylenchus dipsaci TaxID=166011 RepID=A0A915CV29_9BILA